MATLRTRAGARIPAAAYRAILQSAMRPGPPVSPAQIRKELERLGFDRRDVSLRTIERIVRELDRQDTSGPWTLLEAPEDEAALVLPVLADLAEMTYGRVTRPTRKEAAAIAKFRRIVSDLPALQAYWLSKFKSSPAVEQYLTFAPWRDGGTRLRSAVRNDAVPEDVLYFGDWMDALRREVERHYEPDEPDEPDEEV